MAISGFNIKEHLLMVSATFLGPNQIAFCAQLQEAIEQGESISQVLFWLKDHWVGGPILDL